RVVPARGLDRLGDVLRQLGRAHRGRLLVRRGDVGLVVPLGDRGVDRQPLDLLVHVGRELLGLGDQRVLAQRRAAGRRRRAGRGARRGGRGGRRARRIGRVRAARGGGEQEDDGGCSHAAHSMPAPRGGLRRLAGRACVARFASVAPFARATRSSRV